MGGRPVWLASVAMRGPGGEIVPTPALSAHRFARAQAIARQALEGAGDRGREVLFRMNLSTCLHRGLTEAEEASLPESFHRFCATDTAGTAVEVLYVRGVSGVAHLPCERPTKRYLRAEPHYWLPEPCGECGPCAAREAVRCAA